MVSIMNDFKIENESASSATLHADLSFIGMESLQEGARFSEGGYVGSAYDHRVSSLVDIAQKLPDLEGRVSGNVVQGAYGSLAVETKMDMDVGVNDFVSLVEENRVSFLQSGGWMHGFRTGDMVWGKVKSHPWWPGHIFNEAFASPSVRRTKREGHVLVAFFGDSSYGWFDPAELIPFEPYFPEKSRQTTSRNFVRAVEEAVDEASRRGALAVACCCRNPHNFRPTGVPEYFAVDVVGYEPGGFYSSRQIKKARDSFVPVEILSFVKQLGTAPHSNNRNSIEWIQSIAKLMAYRRAIFEEFDDTYAQAFGVQPMRPTPNSMGILDQPERFTPRVAPLSGPLVVAEALGDRRNSTKLALQKAAKVAKKNKYLLKRREDLPTPAISSLPDVPSVSQTPQHHGFLGPLPATGELPVPNLDSNYILQKREHTLPPQLPPILAVEPSGDGWISKKDASLPPGNSEPAELKNERGASEPLLPIVPVEHQIPLPFHAHVVSAVPYDMGAVEEEKMQKRPRDNLNEINEWKKLKKKKKNDLDADHRSIEPQVRTFGTVVNAPDFVPEEVSVDMNLPPGLDLSMLQLPQLLNDLSSIALDPFYASERGAPSIVRHVLLRFRSLVYQKSLILPAASEPASLAQASPAEASAPLPREGREQRELVAVKETKEHREPSKPPKPVFRLEDTTKKRGPSGRQEQLSVKKMKKLSQMKALAAEKKAAITRKTSETQVQQPQQHKDLKEVAGGTAEASKKQELPAPPKVPSPTFLVMKFPPRSTLPSVANLKARFARFGPLDLSATRVYWKSYSCRVLFKYKSDAQSALDFVKNLDLFGQVKVTYFLRDHEVSSQDQTLPDPAKRPTDSSRHDNSQLRPGVPGGLQRPASLSQPRHNPLQPKSILKKPGCDDSGSNGASGPRVKFMLDVDGEPPTVAASGGNGGNGGGQQAVSLVSAEATIKQTTKSVGFFVPPPQARPRVLPSLPAAVGEPWNKSSADISGPMLSLLLKCNDIVSNVKASLGYNPYHAL